MRVRPLLVITAIVSSALGAIVVYLVLTVPNDVQAGALMRQARQDLAAGRTRRAKESLSRIVQQYPRTDAAAAATVALVNVADSDRAKLQHDLEALRRDQSQQAGLIVQLQRTVAEMKSAPPPAPIIVQAPARKAPVRKAPVKKRKSSRRSRGR